MKTPAAKKVLPSITLKAPAKINLFLKITGRRTDGYHEIESLMQKVALYDVLHLTRQEAGISLSCPDSSLPEDGTNIVFRAAERFFENKPINMFEWFVEKMPLPARPRRKVKLVS